MADTHRGGKGVNGEESQLWHSDNDFQVQDVRFRDRHEDVGASKQFEAASADASLGVNQRRLSNSN
jgi:hypothetical protein